MSDLADKLNAKELPIPTAQRLDVFVCDGVPDEALRRWESQGGQTTFHTAECSKHISDWGVGLSATCGIVLFVTVAQGHMTLVTLAQLAPFYARAGTETNAFEWQPIEKNFVRRSQDWFNERKMK